MDADSEDAGYGESVARVESEIDLLCKRLVGLWELVDELGNIADFKRIKPGPLRDKIKREVALVRQQLSAYDSVVGLAKIAKAKDRIRYLKRVIRTRESRGEDASGPRKALRNKREKLATLQGG